MLRGEALRSLNGAVQARISPSDIVNMTWWSAFRAFPKFDGDIDAFVGWLRKIHERNIIDVLRDQNATIRNVAKEVPPSGYLPGALARTTTPSQKIVRKEYQQQLEVALEKLPSAQREAVRLRYYENLSVAEITDQMARSETAVAGLLKRGVSGLRELMKEE
jgi:RNA polymerase sigma-70 factor (ECF subfamily)